MKNLTQRPFLGHVCLESQTRGRLPFELLTRINSKYRQARHALRCHWLLYATLFLVIFLLLPSTGFCDVEGTMRNIQGKLINTILPLAAILGFVFAGFSFVAGSPNARSHLMLAVIGAVVGYGAQSIMEFIKGLVK